MLQIHVRGILARKLVKEMRDEEMEFLGMIRPEKNLRRCETARYEVGYGRINRDNDLMTHEEDPFVLLKST